MISASNVTLSFGQRALFKDVNIKFTPGNCYGIIGANGAGKSTFLKILSGEITPDSGTIAITPGERLAVLQQDQFQFDQYPVLHTVIMGYRKLYDVMVEKDAIYQKEDFTEEDGLRAAELEGEFAEMGGWEAESEAARMLSGLGIEEKYHHKLMADLEGGQKVRVLLAQALFGEPDILLLDEPTNNLDLESVSWLEDFLYGFPNTVIVVSHDRHFLNTVCTHIADIDFGKIQLYVGNYDFWYHSSQLIQKQMRDEKKRREDKVAELREFIQRFSSNAARSRQATSRQKLIDKLSIDDIQPSSRKRPYVNFDPEREPGKKALEIRGLSLSVEGEDVLKDLTLTVHPGDKIAFVGPYHQAKTALFSVLAGEAEGETGEYEWGTTMTAGYFPKDNSSHFEADLSIIDWLRQYTRIEEEAYVRGFLGRMLFSGDESLKSVKVLSGGERVRCMLSMLMLSRPNALILDEPTNHLDLESITALNDALIDFPGNVLFSSHDHEFVNTVANRIVELTPGGIIDKTMSLDEYLKSDDVRELRDSLYHGHHTLEI
ncbi:ABC transporter ATP-binding protein [Alkalispirochaeta sphaeroplastigenens]|uniref:Probable ATP-binding protein YbiT n=1 Tax=Alkalispirochaeta sphaeroplastigenens TaxID=1187066 RepID=A0A2S4K119_9SPIO|nr:ATP-binding cassette domain-containing protein [Alkalispirochaeta sphaeroplastigenens]POR05464.1 ABC transporter ATP-binding protein [Alkalispirochaeta sphaeroplastigenens]